MLLPYYRKNLHVSSYSSQGIFLHLKSMNARQKQFEQRKDEIVSPEESRALKLLLETCEAIAVKKFHAKRKHGFYRTL
jgi:hypothetical protein